MTTLKCSKVYKTLGVVTLFISFLSCKTEEEKVEINYLGFPKSNSFTLRVNPSNLISKGNSLFNISDTVSNSTTQKQSTTVTSSKNDLSLGILSEVLGNMPNTTDLIKNHYKELQPDLSKNWVSGGDLTQNGTYAFLYLSYSGEAFLNNYIKEKRKTFTSDNGIEYCYLDEAEELQTLIAKQDKHLFILSHQGNKNSCLNIFTKAQFNTKDSFLAHYKKTFNTTDKDLDLLISPSSKLLEKIQHPLANDILSSSKFTTSLSLKGQNVTLNIKPHSTTLLDSLFKEANVANTGLAHASTNIDLDAIDNFLIKYNLKGSVNHELKKLNTTLEELKKISNGELSISYLGMKATKEKVISYEYDDNFNQVEKVKYNTTYSHDLKGNVGLSEGKKSLKELQKRKWIVKQSSNKYELIALSKSPITFINGDLTIGVPEKENLQNSKLLLTVNDPKKISEIFKIKEFKKYDYIESASINLTSEDNLAVNIKLNNNSNELINLFKGLAGIN